MAHLFANFETRVRKDGATKAKAEGGDRRIVFTTHTAGWDAKNRHGLPEVMLLDAALILGAMGVQTETAEEMLYRIDGLLELIPRESVEKVREASYAAEKDTAKLKRIIARCNELADKNETTKKENV
jgi:hypothetical protein